MTEGRILPKIVKFTLPVMAAGVLQLLYNAADMIVVGKFAEPGSLGAVGATSALINLIVNLFVGLSVGACVSVARYYGKGDNAGVSRTSNTAVVVALIGGVVLGIFGFFMCRPLLTLMGTPADVIDRAVLYMKIYFIGLPGNMLYNFGSAVMRGCGDTRRPLHYLAAAGLVNVALNLVFVIVFHMGVAGVAIATITAQAISAFLVLRFLFRTDGAGKISFKTLKIDKKELKLITAIGLPSGIQGCVFSISNVLIQSSVNSFGSVVMDGNTAAQNIEGFVYISMNSVSQAALTFVSQNYGVKNYDRIKKAVGLCCILAGAVGLILGFAAFGFADNLISLYSNLEAPDPQVAYYAKLRLSMIATTYLTCGVMDVLSNCVRGIGHSTVSMVVSLLGACAFRVLWIYTVFAADHSLQTLYISYPVSWIITDIAHLSCFIFLFRRLKKRKPPENADVTAEAPEDKPC